MSQKSVRVFAQAKLDVIWIIQIQNAKFLHLSALEKRPRNDSWQIFEQNRFNKVKTSLFWLIFDTSFGVFFILRKAFFKKKSMNFVIILHRFRFSQSK